MTSASPSPKSPEINEKTKKYDRQLRLWGDRGQWKLESSHVCLINANATGTEILKSLVLPGIGNFTIIDGHKVTEEDLGNNFFLESDSLGKSRGESACKLLLEMNSDVSGNSIEEDVSSILNSVNNRLDFFAAFSFVIASQLSERTLKSLSKVLWDLKVPFIYCHCIGLIGWIRLQIAEHTIIESHPEPLKHDLRVDSPFPELVQYVNEIKINGRDDAIKTPWLILLFKAINFYLNQTTDSTEENGNGNGNSKMDTDQDNIHPCKMSPKQKREFKEFLHNFLLEKYNLQESDEILEDTLKALNNSLRMTEISSDVKQIFKDEMINKPQNKFWIMCSALKDFYQSNGVFPVSGTLPDMTADSEKYISLQNIYREKAIKDAEEVYGRCQQILKQSGLSTKITLRGEDVRIFCKEAFNLNLIRGDSLAVELDSIPNGILLDLAQNPDEPCDTNKIYYAIMRGVLRFHAEFHTYPGQLDQDVEPDIARFKGVMTKMLNEWNSSLSNIEDCIHEICRCGGSEIPSVAAVIGGAVAFEVIKIITSQYVPLHDTLIYNAIDSTTSQFKAISTTGQNYL